MPNDKTVTTKKAWTMAHNGEPIAFYARHTRKASIKAFEDNIVQPPPQSSDRCLTVKDFPGYSPVKISMKVIA